MASQLEKGKLFRSLHQRKSIFIIPNPWDAGSALLLAHLGFEALATTSLGAACSIGKRDADLSRDESLANAAAIAHATHLPVSADLENGFGDSPEKAAETIRLAAAAGVVGGSIEDFTGRPEDPIYDISFAAERIRAAVEAARALPFPFTLVARAENHLHGRTDLSDTIKRLQAYQEAGADVLYAPGLKTKEQIAALVSSVDRPVNVVMGIQGVSITLAELDSLGVRRVSVGGSLYRSAIAGFLRAADEMRQHGTFTYAESATNGRELQDILAQTAARARQ